MHTAALGRPRTLFRACWCSLGAVRRVTRTHSPALDSVSLLIFERVVSPQVGDDRVEQVEPTAPDYFAHDTSATLSRQLCLRFVFPIRVLRSESLWKRFAVDEVTFVPARDTACLRTDGCGPSQEMRTDRTQNTWHMAC